jgi:hypothetical protein
MYSYPLSPADIVNWASTQQKALAFWQRAAATYVSASLTMMQNFNQVVSASLPLTQKVFELGEAAVSQRAETPSHSVEKTVSAGHAPREI